MTNISRSECNDNTVQQEVRDRAAVLIRAKCSMAQHTQKKVQERVNMPMLRVFEAARAEQRRGCDYYSLIEQPRILRLKENLVDILFKRKLLMD